MRPSSRDSPCTSAAYPRTRGLLPEHPHALHLDEIDILIETDSEPFPLADAIITDVERSIA